MPVVINEFEAIADSEPQASDQGGGKGGKTKLKPSDVRQPLRALLMRRARLRAH